MPWSAPNPAPACPACSRSVFPAEAVMAADRKPFHKQCVKCSECTKKLVPANMNDHRSKLYCNLCYANQFMPKEDNIPSRTVMQVLPVGGTYAALEEEKRRLREAEQRRLEEEQARKHGGCPTCLQLTIPDDSVDLSGVRFHKACLKCSTCLRPADEQVPMMLGPRDSENVFGEDVVDPYCKFCFAKKFNMAAFNIAETVAIV